jgi:PAS domain S-box-containing protein
LIFFDFLIDINNPFRNFSTEIFFSPWATITNDSGFYGVNQMTPNTCYKAVLPSQNRYVWLLVLAAITVVGIIFGTRTYVDYIELVIFLLFASLAIVITRVMLQRAIVLKQLDETQSHLAAIVEFSDDAIISKDLNGIILSWNAGAERLFAYPPEEAVGQSITMLIPPERQDEENLILQNLKAGKLVNHLETVRITKDGRQLDVSVTSSPLKDNTGAIIGASKIIRDITERKLAEQELQAQSEELQVQNEELQTLGEELQAQNEELQMQSEELQTQSEELQTQSEELQMQSEELQAQNEELQMQSEELQTQGEELTQLWEQSRQAAVLMRTITNSISDPLFLKDCSCRLLLANTATLAVLGKRIDEVIGKTDEEIYDDPAIGRLMMANDHRVMESGQTEIIEEIVPGPGGNRTFLSSKTPYRDDAGCIIGIICIARDITERKRSEEALRESEFFFKESQRAASIGSYKTDFITGRWESSEILDSIFGIDSEYIRNVQGWLDLVHPDDRDMMNQYLREEVIAKRNHFSKEYRIIRKNDGEARWVHGLGKIAYDRNDTPISLIGTIQNITERKLAEKALIKIHTELESRVEERTSDLVEAVKILEDEMNERQKAELNLKRLNRLYAVLSETNQTIVKINDRDSLFKDFCRIAVEHGGFALSWIGLMDRQSGKLNIVASSGATAYLNDVRISAKNEPEGEGPSGIAIRKGTYHICNDFQNEPCTRPWHDQGKKYGICASASVAIKEDGQVIGVLSLYRGEKNYFDVQQVELLLQMGMDISFALDNLNRENNRKETEKALYEETSERLKTVETLREKEQMLIQQSRQAAMGEMISNIAHQWRQPLNTLGLNTQKLGVFYGMPSFNKEFLDNSIAKSMEIIKHMSKTIDDFRNYFNPEKEKTDFYVINAIKNTLSLLEGNFHNPKITVDLVEHDNPVINGYQNEFAQVFLNILNNARDAVIEREIVDARVTITICSENNCAVVTVADNAEGISDEIISKVFDPYFTTKGPQSGTGIGLFMAKAIIEKNMGGKLAVRNTDIGAEFRIEV